MKRVSGIFTLSCALCCSLLCAVPVAAESMEYLYRGNHFVELEGITGLFSPGDHVTATFTIDCAIAHTEGNCRHLPYDDYFSMGAIDVKSIRFSAGPVVLPSADGSVEFNAFSFSTDYWRSIVDWDMDLSLSEAGLNVDTDNVNGGTDSAAAPGESANVKGQPGAWGYQLTGAESDFDLVVNKTADNPVPVAPQQVVEFTVSIVNRGPGPAKDVVVVDQLPPELAIPQGMAAYTSAGYYDPDSGRWEVGDLDTSLPQIMTLPVIVQAGAEADCIINTASIEAPKDNAPENDTSTAAVRSPDLRSCVDLRIEELKLQQQSINCEESFWARFDIRIVNPGPETAHNVVLNIEETLFNVPGLTVSHPNCDGLRCTWSALDQGSIQTVAGESERFNVDEPTNWGINAVLSSQSGEYDNENNSETAQITLFPKTRPEYCDARPADPDWNLSGVGAGGGCFIATASYGSEWHPHVQALRGYRDRVLMKTAMGRELVGFYYRHSPEIACYIAERDSLRTVTRWLLTPIVFAITYPWSALLFLASLALLLYAVAARSLGRQH